MQIVTTHNNADFDALASLVAAGFVYPEAVRVMPSQAQPAVRRFLALHRDVLLIRPRRGLDVSQVSHLIVTDTGSWQRLDDLHHLAARPGLKASLWDHHPLPASGAIAAGELYREEIGATVTLLLERMRDIDSAFAPMHATLFLLGLYDDTGGLRYPSTTPRDIRMAAWLLENGADLNVVSAYLDSALDDAHLDVFNRMLAQARIHELGGVSFGICVQETNKGLSHLAQVVSQFKDIKGLDVALGIFVSGPSKALIIGRGNPRLFDIGALMRHFGGNGHAGAGSAVVKEAVEPLCEKLIERCARSDAGQAHVSDLMTQVRCPLSARDTLGTAADRLHESGRSSLLVLDDDGRLLGSLGEQQLLKMGDDLSWEHPVSALMQRADTRVAPGQSAREALRLMSSVDVGVLPVLEGGQLVGEITRAAIMLNMYDF
jgi:nanoRNase/pAp phosphatase (c-di-AMP/oligoRNAs hydrolase)